MQIVWGGASNSDVNDTLARWCAEQIGLPRPFEQPYTTMGVVNGNDLAAVILWNNYQPEAGVIEFHGAATDKRWLNRRTLEAMFSYPFAEIGCQMIVSRNAESNAPLHRMLTSYGFDRFYIPRLRGRNEGEMIWTLTDDQWRASKFYRGS
jgi:hypothetical protein